MAISNAPYYELIELMKSCYDRSTVLKRIDLLKEQGAWDSAHKFTFNGKEVNILEAAAFTDWASLCEIIKHEKINLKTFPTNLPNFSFLGQLMESNHSAAYYMKTLIAHGADVNKVFKTYFDIDYTSKTLSTPLQKSIDLGLPELVAILKEEGADFSVKVTGSGALSINWLSFQGEGISLTEYAKKIKDYRDTLAREDYKIDRSAVLEAVREASGGNVAEDATIAEAQQDGIFTIGDVHHEEDEETSVAGTAITTETVAEAAQTAEAHLVEFEAALAEQAREDLVSPAECLDGMPINTGPTRTTILRPVAEGTTAQDEVIHADYATTEEIEALGQAVNDLLESQI